MGYHHIPQPFAARINQFYRDHLIPYLNFHRPCAFPKVDVLPNGKKKITMIKIFIYKNLSFFLYF